MNKPRVDTVGVTDEKSQLTPEQIADDFGAGPDSLASFAIRHLFRRLTQESRTNAIPAFQQWKELFGHGSDLESITKKKSVEHLVTHYAIDDASPLKLLFAVHTYYALLIKLLSAHVMTGIDALEADDAQTTKEFFQSLEGDSFWSSRALGNFLEGDIFSWYIDAWNERTTTAFDPLIEKLKDYETKAPNTENRLHRDLLKTLYQSLLPSSVRHDMGEYYTPDWLADLTLREVDYHGALDQRILDPACGSGTYLVAAINRIRQRYEQSDHDIEINPENLAAEISKSVIGFDINPMAVLAARANYLWAIHDLLGDEQCIEIPVHRRDAIVDDAAAEEAVDVVVGNPPWVNWQHLDAHRREELKPLWKSYGLFSLSGTRGRMGGGKKDLSMLFTYACADKYLKSNGRLGFLITHSVFKSKGAGDGFRRFRYDDAGATVYLHPTIVHDFTAFQPFEGAATQTALCCLQKSTTSFEYPVSYRRWTKHRRGRIESDTALDEALSVLDWTPRAAQPVDDDRDTSPWLTAPPTALSGITKVIGHSDYRAYEGVNSGGLNGCYWVREIQRTLDGYTVIENLADVGRIKVERIRREVESQRVFPLLRSGDLQRWSATPENAIILAQNPDTRSGIEESRMAEEFPKTHAYFKTFEGSPRDPQRGTLRGRSLFRRYYNPDDPFYSMYGVGPYTMRPWKVCWTRIDTRLRAAVVGPDDDQRIVLPQETITFIPLDDPDEAHYFCALFNSSPSDALVRCYSTGKGFASAHILDRVAIPGYDADNPLHHELSVRSRNCHHAARRGDGDDIQRLHHEIDERAARLWGLDGDELAGIQQGFGEV